MNGDGTRPQSDQEVPPPNPQHVDWLKEGVESWNRRRKEEPFDPVLTRVVVGDRDNERYLLRFGTLLSQIDWSGVDLSGADLRGSMFTRGVFRGADLTGANLTGVLSLESDFGNADLRGARLSEFLSAFSNFQSARFGNTRISGDAARVPLDLTSEFNGTRFRSSDLTGADFSDASLSGASFRGSDLSRANLIDADLTGVNLVESRLWRARLFEGVSLETDLPHHNAFDFHGVGSLRDLIDLRRHLWDVYENSIKRGLVAFYFRGEPCTRLELRPTVMRQTKERHWLRPFESGLLTGLKTESPAEFSGCEYAIDELAIARHFGLPSRLLDVTRNPQVGLYWSADRCHLATSRSAVGGSEENKLPHGACDGQLHVFTIPTDLVCPYDSDRVSIVANFARLAILQQEHLLTKRRYEIEFKTIAEDETAWDLPRNSVDESRKTLLHNIRREKPYFTDDIDIRDLFRVFVVEPRRSFDRIRAQGGAFMLSAFHERFEGDEVNENLAGTKLYDHHVLTIPAGAKDEIRDELDWMGINKQTLYADVESTVEAVADRFRKLAAMTL